MLGFNGNCACGERRPTNFIGGGGSQADIIAGAALAEGEVAVSRATGKGDDTSGSKLRGGIRHDPGFDGDLVGRPDGIDDFCGRTGRSDNSWGMDNVSRPPPPSWPRQDQ